MLDANYLDMKALPKLFLALTAVAAFSFAYPVKANQITNPGFEAGNLAGWTLNPGFSAVSSFGGIAPHSGSFEAVSTTGSGVLGQSFVTAVGQSYTVSFWAATITGGALSVFGGATVFNHIFAGLTGYTQFAFTFTAMSTSSTLQFNAAGFFLLDDINVSPTGVGVPDGGTTVSLLGCALLGLVWLRRKLSW
jgi:VPDSG-CTERM motif